MPSIKNPGPKSADGAITYADVLAHVPVDVETGAVQATNTNAGVIRAALGRGSNQTVQKHLDAIRAELEAAAAPKPAGAVPDAPAEAVGAMWAAAWTAAQVAVLSRLETVTMERDQARTRVDVLTADRDAATAEADEQRERAAAAAAACDDATMTLADRETDLDAQVAAANAALSAAEAALVREREQAQHAAALVSREREIERQALQGQIDRLQERVAELRALEIWAASQKKAGNDSPD
jgi:beta-galactosidase/beta-glucuronidase